MARGTAADGGVPESYAELVRALSERLSAAPDDQAVWEVYSETERLIALMRFRLGHETPGRFAKLPAASETDGLVARARALLAQ
ncbi:MAG: hypothetical protein JRM86_04370, partial [Nitrososphaerota archaeon]|nr:hypothetical protein [Nitrososphaerota archaeon]